MNIDFRKARQGAEHDTLDAGLHGRGQRDGISVTTETSVDPENVNDGFLCRAWQLTREMQNVLRSKVSF